MNKERRKLLAALPEKSRFLMTILVKALDKDLAKAD